MGAQERHSTLSLSPRQRSQKHMDCRLRSNHHCSAVLYFFSLAAIFFLGCVEVSSATKSGVSLVGQTFNSAHTITIDPQTDSALTIERCTFKSTLSIVQTQASYYDPPLENFHFIIKDSSVTSWTSFALRMGPSSTVQFEKNTFTGHLQLANVPFVGVSFTFEKNQVLHYLFINNVPFKDKTSVVFRENTFTAPAMMYRQLVEFANSPTTVGSTQLWEDNTIDSTRVARHALYFHTASVLDETSTMTMRRNTIKAQTGYHSFHRPSIDGGTLVIDDSNIFSMRVSVTFRKDVSNIVVKLHNCPSLEQVSIACSSGVSVADTVFSVAKSTISATQRIYWGFGSMIRTNVSVVDSSVGYFEVAQSVPGSSIVSHSSVSLINTKILSATHISTVNMNTANSTIINVADSTFAGEVVFVGIHDNGEVTFSRNVVKRELRFTGRGTECFKSNAQLTVVENTLSPRILFYSCSMTSSSTLVVERNIISNTARSCNCYYCTCKGNHAIQWNGRSLTSDSTVLIHHNVITATLLSAIARGTEDRMMGNTVFSLKNNTVNTPATQYALYLFSSGDVLLQIDPDNIFNGRVTIDHTGNMVPNNKIDISRSVVSHMRLYVKGQFQDSVLALQDTVHSDSLYLDVKGLVRSQFLLQRVKQHKDAFTIQVHSSVNSSISVEDSAFTGTNYASNMYGTLEQCTFTIRRSSFTGANLDVEFNKLQSNITIIDSTFNRQLLFYNKQNQSHIRVENSVMKNKLCFSSAPFVEESSLILRNNTIKYASFESSSTLSGSSQLWEDNVVDASLASAHALQINSASRLDEQSSLTFRRNAFTAKSGYHSFHFDAQYGGMLIIDETNRFNSMFFVRYRKDTSNNVIKLHDCPGLFSVSISSHYYKMGLRDSVISIANSTVSSQIYIHFHANISNTQLTIDAVSQGSGSTFYLGSSASMMDGTSVSVRSFKSAATKNDFVWETIGGEFEIVDSSFTKNVYFTGERVGAKFSIRKTKFISFVQFADTGYGNRCFSNSTLDIIGSVFNQRLQFHRCGVLGTPIRIINSTILGTTTHHQAHSLRWVASALVDSVLELHNNYVYSKYVAAVNFETDSYIGKGCEVNILNNTLKGGTSYTGGGWYGNRKTVIYQALMLRFQQGAKLILNEENAITGTVNIDVASGDMVDSHIAVHKSAVAYMRFHVRGRFQDSRLSMEDTTISHYTNIYVQYGLINSDVKFLRVQSQKTSGYDFTVNTPQSFGSTILLEDSSFFGTQENNMKGTLEQCTFTVRRCTAASYMDIEFTNVQSKITVLDSTFKSRLMFYRTTNQSEVVVANNIIKQGLRFYNAKFVERSLATFRNNSIFKTGSHYYRFAVDYEVSYLQSGSHHVWEDNTIDASGGTTHAIHVDGKSVFDNTTFFTMRRNTVKAGASYFSFYFYSHYGTTMVIENTNLFTAKFKIFHRKSASNNVIMLHNSTALKYVEIAFDKSVSLSNYTFDMMNVKATILTFGAGSHFLFDSQLSFQHCNFYSTYGFNVGARMEGGRVVVSNTRSTATQNYLFIRSKSGVEIVLEKTYWQKQLAFTTRVSSSHIQIEDSTFDTSLHMLGYYGKCLADGSQFSLRNNSFIKNGKWYFGSCPIKNSTVTVVGNKFNFNLKCTVCRSSYYRTCSQYIPHGYKYCTGQFDPVHWATSPSYNSTILVDSNSILGNSLRALYLDSGSVFQDGSVVTFSNNVFQTLSARNALVVYSNNAKVELHDSNIIDGSLYLKIEKANGSFVKLMSSKKLYGVTMEVLDTEGIDIETFQIVVANQLKITLTRSFGTRVTFEDSTAQTLTYSASYSSDKDWTPANNKVNFKDGNKFTTGVSVSCGYGFVSADPRNRFSPSTTFTRCLIDQLLAIHRSYPVNPKAPTLSLTHLSFFKSQVLRGGRVDLVGITFTKAINFYYMDLNPGSKLYIDSCNFRDDVHFKYVNMTGTNMCLVRSSFVNGAPLFFNHQVQGYPLIDSSVFIANTSVYNSIETAYSSLQNSNLILSGSTTTAWLRATIGGNSHVVVSGSAKVKSVTINGCGSSEDGVSCSVLVGSKAQMGYGGGTKSIKKVDVLHGDEHVAPYDAEFLEHCKPVVLDPTPTASLEPTSTPTPSASTIPTRTLTPIVHTNTTSHTDTPSTEPTSSASLSLPKTRSASPPPTVTLVPVPSATQQVNPPTATVSESITMAAPIPPPPTLPPPTPAPTPNVTEPPPTQAAAPPAVKRQREAKKSLMVSDALGGNEEVGSAVAASSASAVAASSAMAPTAASQLSRVVSATQAVNCVMDPGDERPSSFELPIQPAIGSGKLRYYAGGALASSLLLAGLFVILCILRKLAQEEYKHIRNIKEGPAEKHSQRQPFKFMLSGFGAVVAVALLYFSPNIVGTVVMVGMHGDSIEKGVSFAALCVMLTIVAFITYFLTGNFGAKIVKVNNDDEGGKTGGNSVFGDKLQGDNVNAQEVELEETPPGTKIKFKDRDRGAMFVAAFQPFFDATTDSRSIVRRLYTVEELVTASMMAGIAGIRPGGHCSTITSLILVVAVIHFAYVAYFHPLRTKLDHFFSIFFAGIQVLMGISCVVATVYIESSGEEGAEKPLKVLSVTVLITFAGFFVQTFVQAYWSLHTFIRGRRADAAKKHKKEEKEKRRQERLQRRAEADADDLSSEEEEQDSSDEDSSDDDAHSEANNDDDEDAEEAVELQSFLSSEDQQRSTTIVDVGLKKPNGMKTKSLPQSELLAVPFLDQTSSGTPRKVVAGSRRGAANRGGGSNSTRAERRQRSLNLAGRLESITAGRWDVDDDHVETEPRQDTASRSGGSGKKDSQQSNSNPLLQQRQSTNSRLHDEW